MIELLTLLPLLAGTMAWGVGWGIIRDEFLTPSGPPPPPSKIILEDDSGYLLLEDGVSYILLE